MTGTRVYLPSFTVYDERPPEVLAELLVGAPVWVKIGEAPGFSVRPSSVHALEPVEDA